MSGKCLEIPVLEHGKSGHCFPYLKAAARELLGMTARSAPSERVFSHAGELYSKKRADLVARIFAILMLDYRNESTFEHELNLD